MEIEMYSLKITKDDNGDIAIQGAYEPEYDITDTVIIYQYQIDALIDILKKMKDSPCTEK